jgi:hypothetical protein
LREIEMLRPERWLSLEAEDSLVIRCGGLRRM